jgi:glutaredoxin
MQAILFILTILVVLYLFSGNSKKETVIWFHRPSCPHCVNMQGEWNKFVKQANSELRGIEVKDVNIEKDPETANKFQITSVPFIIKIKSCGKQMVYTGDRTAKSLMEFAKNA